MADVVNPPLVDITMPRLGETVVEGTITRWFKQAGEAVSMDETLFEVSTDKVDTEVPSPVAGVVHEILAGEGDVVEVGQVLARVGDLADAAALPGVSAAGPPSAAPSSPDSSPETPPASVSEPSEADRPSGGSAPDTAGLVMSPIVRRLIADNGLDPASITGTGIGARITRADVEQEIRARVSAESAASPPRTERPSTRGESDGPSARRQTERPSTQPPRQPRPSSAAQPRRTRSRRPAERVSHGPGDRIVPLNNIRRRTAEHMTMSKRTAPHVLSAVEVDYEAVEKARRPVREAWKAEEGFSLTYLPFIARAVVDSLREYPNLNASFADDELVLHGQVNLAIAVDVEFQGLLAPVIHGAEGKRLRRIAREIVDVATRARSRRLKPDDLSSGTFTITNAGRYGTLLQFPIINQPQVAILSTDGISRKPVVVTDDHGGEAIAIHSVGVLAMAWDHRAFDGAYAAAFLHRVKQIIETRDWTAEIR